MCCVALCQYIEATKFRDGARGNLAGADEGNPHTTHTPPPLNLSSALSLQPLTWHTLFFLFFYSAALFCYFKCSVIFCTGVGTCPFCCTPLWFLSSWFLVSPPPSHPSAAAEQWADVWQSLLLFLSHTHKSSAACTGIAWSVFTPPPPTPQTLNDFSVLPWCVHHFCFSLGSNQLNLCFLWFIILCVHSYCH